MRTIGTAFLAALLALIHPLHTSASADTASDVSLSCIICTAPSGIAKIKDGSIVMVNDYISRLLGYRIDELLKRNDRVFYACDEEYARVNSEQQSLMTRYTTGSLETRWLAKDGNVLDVQLFFTPLEPGDISSGIVYTIQDITERKQADLTTRKRAREGHVLSAVAAGVIIVFFLLLKRSLDTTKKSEHNLKLFKDALESSTDAIGMSTPQGRHYYQNRAFDQLFGSAGVYPPDTLFVDKALGESIFKTIIAGGQWTGEIKMYGHNGRLLDVFLRAYAAKDKNGEIIALVGIHTDITDRRQAEDALRESEDKLSTILHSIDDVVMSYSLKQDRMLYLSPSLGKVFGRNMEDFEKNWCLWMEAVHPDDLRHIEDNSARLGEMGFSDEEFRIIRPDGNVAWVRSRTKIIYTDAGEPDRLDRIITDITERKQAELALRESEKKFATLFSAMTEMVVLHELVFDDQGRPVNYRITDCNRAFSDITGIVRQNAVGRLATDVYATAEPPYLARYSRVAMTGESYQFETYFDKMEKHFSISVVSPEKNTFATITSDITRRRHDEQKHESLQTQLKQAQKIESIGKLAGGVAHDFNNILGVILGYTDMALQHVETDQALHADLMEIRHAVMRSSKLTRQLLAFARKQTIAPRVLDLNATVEELLKMLRRLIGENIDLAWLPGKNLLPVRVDPSQLDQVLANLCVNARDAIANVGTITIETGITVFDSDYCRLNPGCAPGTHVMLAVSDNGCGMDRETLANIFDPFFTTKDIGTGTGLGLSTVYGIVKQNNGCINVYSEPGHGTRFTIYLPPHVESADTAPDTTGPQAIIARGTETILLVEDEAAILEMVRRMLVDLRYTVLPASTPEAGIQLARDHDGHIDLLMTDVVMPDMNGRDLADTIVAIRPGMHCLFMSGYTDKAITHQGVLDPGTCFIQKPFSLEELAAGIRAVLDG